MSLFLSNIWLGAFLVAAGTSAAIGIALFVRRYAPIGGFFSDSERAAAVFGAIGTMFSILLALVIFLSVETYTATQSRANAEADSVLEQFQLAQLFPSQDQYRVQSRLICYGRSVARQEWPLLDKNRESAVVNAWASEIDSAIDSVQVTGSRAEAGFELFLDQTLKRQEERRGRLQGAEGALPPTVWPILLLGAAGMIAYMIAYADRGERRLSQVFQVGVVTVLLGASLVLIGALNHPFNDGPGQIKPTKMENSVAAMQRALSRSIDSPDLESTLPCDRAGLSVETTPALKRFPEGSTMQQIVSRGKLVVGVSYGISLFGKIDPVSNRLSGFDIELGREIARELGLLEEQVEFVDTLIEDRIPALQEGRVDMIILAMTITPERAQLVDFSRPYFLAGQSILVRKTTSTISSLRDLAGKRVCIVPTSTSAGALAELAPDAVFVLQPSFTDCVSELNGGRADAVSTDDIILAGFAATDQNLTLVGGQFTREPYGIAFPKGRRDIVDFVNTIINTMIVDGRWGRIYYEYLGDIAGLPSVADAKAKLLAAE